MGSRARGARRRCGQEFATDVSRSSRYRCGDIGARGLQRGRDLLHHGPQAERRASDPDRALSAARRRGRSQRDCEIKSSQTRAGRSNRGRKSPNCAPNCAENRERENGEDVGRSIGWGGRTRTSEWRNQNPLPYHLATPHQAAFVVAAARGPSRRQLGQSTASTGTKLVRLTEASPRID